MSIQKEYRVGEIFRHNGETLQCVANIKGTLCDDCALLRSESCPNCISKYRSDKTDVHFIRVTEPEEGMLFRASDDKLYELKKLENFECGCYIIGYTNCTVISYEAFGEDILDIFHWYPVEEKKEEEKETIDYSKIDLQKVHTKRHLELAVVAVENDIVKFKVSDQFYCGDEFSKQEIKSEFKANHGLIIQLDEKFEWDGYNGILTLNRFQNVSKHEETTLCTVYNFAAIMQAITEYNETDGKGYENPWPKEDDKYWFVYMFGAIGNAIWCNSAKDDSLKKMNNLFRTHEEAEAALERVKKALKGEN